MRSLWRFLLLCLMAVALPVQGFAAAGAVHCAAMHERMQPAGDHHAADAADAGEHHHAQAADHHPQGADHHAAGEAGRKAGKCSACAACCAALALPAPALLLPPLKADGAPSVVIADAVVAFLTSGPERPPRTPLA